MKLSIIFLATSAILCSMQVAFGQILQSHVAFVIDNTGSMGDEIGSVKTWLTNCVNGVYPDCAAAPTGGWILSTFNDPGVGPVVATSNPATILTAIGNLAANGGGDCPEKAMQGILDALPSVHPVNLGCKIFFFTDATAKDISLLPQVQTQILQKDCTFYPVLTGCCGTCQDPCLSLPPAYCENNVVDATGGLPGTGGIKEETGGIKEETAGIKEETAGIKEETAGIKTDAKETIYYNLAHKTGGKIILASKEKASKTPLLSILESELKIVSCPTDKIIGPMPNGFSKEVCKSKKFCWDGVKNRCYCQSASKCTAGSTPPPSCEGKRGYSFHPDHGSCSKYYICGFGTRYHLNCRKDTIFNRRLLRCDRPESDGPPCGTGEF